MFTEGPILGPGTVDDLVADARLLGRKSSQRMIMDWQELGLLDYPQAQPGRGRGKGRAKSLYSANQRKLFRELIRKRAEVRKIATLACIPVYLWAYWGAEYVPLTQTRRAMRTHLAAFSRPSLEGSRQLADELVTQFADPEASEWAKSTARRLVADAMHSGRTVDKSLESALLDVYDPRGKGRRAGPPGIDIDVGMVTKTAIVREIATRQLLDPTDPVPDEIFGEARTRMAAGLREYLQVRPELAATAGDMSGMFAAPKAAEIVQGSCSTLTTLVGQLLKERS